jgi:hypothetical protein
MCIVCITPFLVLRDGGRYGRDNADGWEVEKRGKGGCEDNHYLTTPDASIGDYVLSGRVSDSLAQEPSICPLKEGGSPLLSVWK